MTLTPSRAAELEAALAAVRTRIAAGAREAGRSADEVTLVVVTKTYPASDVELLARLGVRDVAENRDQEASGKAEALARADLAWHFVGQLQTNKARSVARYAACVHSVDRPSLVAALSRARAELGGPPLRCLLQVSLDGDPRRGGVEPKDLPALAEEVAAAPALALGGVMAVAPLGQDPRRAFEVLPALSATVRSVDPAAGWISAGMSSDLEAALAWGATHLRVGSAILGRRPTVQ
ncbi:MAG: YggS family pyridoxal phosphate-dependent enzyme [Kineosporiaceae bacterium]